MCEACRREVREETGLEVSVGAIVAVVERRLEGFHYVIVDFMADLQSTSPRIPQAAGDVTDARWVSMQELDRYALVEGLAPILSVASMLHSGTATGGLTDVAGDGLDYIA